MFTIIIIIPSIHFEDIGSLEVFTMGSDGAHLGPAFTKTGAQGDVWIQGSADIVYIGEFKVNL